MSGKEKMIRKGCLGAVFALLVMTVMLCIPTKSKAYEEWIQCEFCGNWLRDNDDEAEVCHDNGCSGGHCSLDQNFDCWVDHHCQTCGKQTDDFCEDCGRCEDCQQNDDDVPPHCTFCGRCGIGDIELCEACTSEIGEPVCMECAKQREDLHCYVCGACFNDGAEACEGCYEDQGFYICTDCCQPTDEGHCGICGEHACLRGGWCITGGPENHCYQCFLDEGGLECRECGRILCTICIGEELDEDEVCLECEMCTECAEATLNHCPLCHECSIEPCLNGGMHCTSCCEDNGWLCSNCGRCLEALDLEPCEYCGLCPDCCATVAEGYGCSCGDYCVEGDGWDDHFCPDCGICFDEQEQCELCGLCEECCASNSDCTDGLCINDLDYDEHFCSACGLCFHEVMPCPYCEEVGYYLCTGCCAKASQDEGCEHGICMHSGYWQCHFNEASKNCRTVAEHSYDSTDVCEFCGTRRDGKPVILIQPQDSVAYVLDHQSETADASNISYFTVYAEGEDLQYQWYTYRFAGKNRWVGTPLSEDNPRFSGTKTNTLTVIASETICTDSEKGRSYYCRVRNSYGEVATVDCVQIGRHRAAIWVNAPTETVVNVGKYMDGGWEVPVTYYASTTHRYSCVGNNHHCEYYEKEEAHEFTAWQNCDGVMAPNPERGYGFAVRQCRKCEYVEYKKVKYVDPHEHVWSNTYACVDDVYHAQVCSHEGCMQLAIKTTHVWSGWTVSVAATEKEQGEEERHCTLCGAKQTRLTEKLPHTHVLPRLINGYYTFEDVENGYVKHTTTQHWAVCEDPDCNYVTPKADHVWTYDYIDGNEVYAKVKQTCAVCKYSKTITVNTGDANFRVLSELGTASYRENVGDDWIPVKDYVPQGSQVKVELSPSSATASSWDVLAFGNNVSVYVMQQFKDNVFFYMPKAHVWVSPILKTCDHVNKGRDYKGYLAPTCTVNGKEDNVYCSYCHTLLSEGEVIPATGHNYKVKENTVRAATCTNQGYTGTMQCVNCGKTEKGGYVQCTGHNWSEEKLLRTADCERTGYYGRKCSNCGKEERTQTIPSWGGHVMDPLYMDADPNQHYYLCGRCGEVIPSTMEDHVFDVHEMSDGSVVKCCSVCCCTYRGTYTGRTLTIVAYCWNEKKDLSARIYPATTTDEAILSDLESEESIAINAPCTISDCMLYSEEDDNYEFCVKFWVPAGKYKVAINKPGAAEPSILTMNLEKADQRNVTWLEEKRDPADIVGIAGDFEGKVGVLFYVNVPDYVLMDKGAYVETTLDGVTKRRLVSEAPVDVKNGITRREFSRYATSTQLSTRINLRMFLSDGTEVPLTRRGTAYPSGGYNFSVFDYCGLAIDQGSGYIVNFAKAVIAYGEIAQIYFGRNAEGLTADPSLSDTKIDAVLANYYANKTSGTVPEGLNVDKPQGVYVVLNEATTLRITWKFLEGADPSTYAYAINGNPVAVKYEGGDYFLEVRNIPAKQLSDVYTFSISKGGKTYTWTGSALSYAHLAVSKGSGNVQKLGRAMYLYNKTARLNFNYKVDELPAE